MPQPPSVDGQEERVKQPDRSKTKPDPVGEKGDIAGQGDQTEWNDALHAEGDHDEARGNISGSVTQLHFVTTCPGAIPP